MELKGSTTEANLWQAFAMESKARNKYTFYASQAKKEGYEQIAGIFEETADNERAHAKLWFDRLVGNCSTPENLKDAAAGEHYEWTDMYKNMEATARQEGFPDIADTMHRIAEIEQKHEERYARLIANFQNDLVFRCDHEIVWVCRNCGYIVTGKEAPPVCPACGHPRAFFERRAENY